ncbi:hypothetical protein E0Z10_g468 [Xylaria hypoxylon]|uniref:MYND-type domain-containing protein n=1 Tax=Xylaria hypoxylon TaxID=37992 RepID=A0A4Z0Z9P0_9PEZI|nr:hypothetical protein E0Z10_g468 [Xylaria hypoxylon]
MATQPEQMGISCSNANEGQAAYKFDPADGVQDHDALSRCTVCDSDAKMRCSTCGTWYCNRDCSMKDWPHHKALCKALKDGFNSSKAPTNNVRAILFPMDSSKPTWVWINLKSLDISIVRALGITTRKPLKNPDNQLVAKDINKSLKHRKIGHGIRRFTAPKARKLGLNINRSIFALADPGSLRAYFGSAIFFAFCTYGAEGNIKVCYEDASVRDLRMIIEWYYINKYNPSISNLHRLPIKSYSYPEEEVSLWPAVRVNCDGDTARITMLSRQHFEITHNVQVLSKDVLKNSMVCEFAAMAELPWVVQQCGGVFDPIADHDNAETLFYNWFGRIFAQDMVQNFKSWNLDYTSGWTLPGHLESTHCGSIIVMHKYGCKIDKMHVLCFIKFVEKAFKQATPLHVQEEEEEVKYCRALTSQIELQRFINRKAFEGFWQDFINNQAQKFATIFASPYNNTYAGEVDPVPMTEEEVKKARKEVERLLLEGA